MRIGHTSTANQEPQICATTGWGGQPIKSAAHGGSDPTRDPSERLKPVESHPRIRITFNGAVSDVRPSLPFLPHLN